MSNGTGKLVKEIRRRTRKKYSAEEKIRIVLEGLREEDGNTELCRKEGLHQSAERWRAAGTIPPLADKIP
ncbi:MAG: hypothetical protein L0Y67_01975 [Gammaproteobacteria bacterium]|nr:hypothetical protein [Gammaproteobacteria bacterium]MCI0590367.1 hypothetical protein [Gammaproteobacteria bacterium]